MKKYLLPILTFILIFSKTINEHCDDYDLQDYEC